MNRDSLSLQYCMKAVLCTMTKLRINTTLFLLGIFMFPVIFQPWHIFQHHGHDQECSVHAHHHDPNCDHEPVLPLVSIQSHDHSHDPCYICDYKFPVKDLPTLCALEFTTHQFKELQSVNLVISDLQRVYSLIKPRAPPCSSPELS